MSSPWISTSGSLTGWPRDEVAERDAARHRAAADRDRDRDLEPVGRERRLRGRPELGVHDRELGLDQPDHGRDHVRGHHRVDRRADQPGLGRADLDQVALDRVLAEQHDDVTAAQAAGQQGVGDLVGELVGLPVGQAPERRVRVGALPADQCLLVGEAPRHAFEQIADAGPLPAVGGAPVVQARHVERQRPSPLTSSLTGRADADLPGGSGRRSDLLFTSVVTLGIGGPLGKAQSRYRGRVWRDK